MTGREWQPGDVLLTRGEVALATGASLRSDSTIYFETAGGKCLLANDLSVDARPLVVLDPEDREQVERLMRVVRDKAFKSGDKYPGMTRFADAMQAALREFASPTPPKPDEPTAMWSVVVDGAGDQWVRVLGPDFTDGWVRAGDLPSNGNWTDYRKIDAVKVVRDGVEAGEPS